MSVIHAGSDVRRWTRTGAGGGGGSTHSIRQVERLSVTRVVRPLWSAARRWSAPGPAPRSSYSAGRSGWVVRLVVGRSTGLGSRAAWQDEPSRGLARGRRGPPPRPRSARTSPARSRSSSRGAERRSARTAAGTPRGRRTALRNLRWVRRNRRSRRIARRASSTRRTRGSARRAAADSSAGDRTREAPRRRAGAPRARRRQARALARLGVAHRWGAGRRWARRPLASRSCAGPSPPAGSVQPTGSRTRRARAAP